MNHFRAFYRAALALPFLAASLLIAVPLQNWLFGPVFKNHRFIPNLVQEGVRRLFGIRIEFNAASAPLETKRQAWYVANHMSALDPFVLVKYLLNTKFVAAGWLKQVPLLDAVGRAGGVLFVTQRKDEDLKQRDRGKIVKAFNAGSHVAMFPEGWTNDGSTVELFRAGLAETLYGARAVDKSGNVVVLKNPDILVQPIAIRVKDVNGQDALANPALREAYTMFKIRNHLKQIWHRLGYSTITVELTVFPAIDPKNYPDARELMNDAHRIIARLVAPDQKIIEKAPIAATAGERPTKFDIR